MSKKAEKEAEKAEAIARLREWLKPGDTIYTILRHVSRSGMSRDISVVLLKPNGSELTDLHPNHAIATAIGARLKTGSRDAIVMGGCGMDIGFALAYELSCVLFPDGFGCIGTGCPSNDHSNGDRDYTPHTCNADDPASGNEYASHHKHREASTGRGKYGVCHWHRSGGYALRHRWL